ncbi:ABC transporter ATP-binding protein [Candidatus Eisenbacteria bacterium]|uniref:ABC transporter ATP-binding protein n=1 Tax=Eiseniibacteriota bacterium TaxID=2212470 RepID=A0ABV6YI24_UNCEI
MSSPGEQDTALDAPNGPGKNLLVARDLSAGYGAQVVFRNVTLSLSPGSLTALIGPNGCGKTTLLHTLCGIHPAIAGQVTLQGIRLERLSRRKIARRVTLVSQFADVGFEVTVAEAVSLGRYPWQGPLAPPTKSDKTVVENALRGMDLLPLQERALNTLSGGERQRVYLARALAQATPILLLDEPVANLDLRYQQETYERLRQLTNEQRMAVLVADHHLNLVAATSDHVLVLHDGTIRSAGSPKEIVTEEMIKSVFGARMSVETSLGGTPQCSWVFP